MAQMNLEITGATIDAIFIWNGEKKPLLDRGGGKFTCSFEAKPGSYLYSITVFGAPTDSWTGALTGGVAKRDHGGKISPANVGSSGDGMVEVA